MQYKNLQKKSFYIVFLAVGLLILSCSVPVFAAESDSCGSRLKWSLTGDRLEITGTGDMFNFQEGEYAPWYEYAKDIRTVKISSDVTSIGSLAFYGCTNLISVQIPDSVIHVGSYAFAECDGLRRVDFGSGVECIDEGAFLGCEKLETISLPMSLNQIGSKAFYQCNCLVEVTVPSSVTVMGSEVFAFCEGLIRATVNTSMQELPDWTFYGCNNLKAVSLSPSITSVGDYAFQHCEKLGGIYTQSKDVNVAEDIEQSMQENENQDKEGFVSHQKIPQSSASVKTEDDVMTKTTVTQTEDTILIEKNITNLSNEKSQDVTIFSSTVKNSKDWTMVAEKIERELNNGNSSKMIAELYLDGTVVNKEELLKFADKSVVLRVILADRTIWEIDMSQISSESLSAQYNFSIFLEPFENKRNKIASNTVYQMKFADRFDFNVKVGVIVGSPYGNATLYEEDGRSYEIINTMLIDSDNYAWFYFANIDKHTDYFIGIDVEGISVNEATIPQTMYQEYGLEEDGSYLMDSDGMQYRITGRTSRWGITGKQFAIYVGVAIGATVLVVGSVMFTLYIIKKSREKYERMAEEEAIREQEEEEALRMEIMKELLGENDKKE